MHHFNKKASKFYGCQQDDKYLQIRIGILVKNHIWGADNKVHAIGTRR